MPLWKVTRRYVKLKELYYDNDNNYDIWRG
jgi:hypothetical protein